ncbi:MAG: DoxX family membrane protein [Bacteroidales bacterium]
MNYIYSKAQFLALLLLRLAVGWHFLYEGLSKLLNPKWTSYGYLMDAEGFLSGLFHSLASNPMLLKWADVMNMTGLTLVGLSLMTGCLVSWASVGGILMLILYFLSHIPFIDAAYLLPTEGSYLWIDKNIIEIFTLLVIIYFPTSRIVGIDRWLYRSCTKRKEEVR